MAKLYARKSDGTYVPYNPQSVTNIDVVQTTGDSVTAAMSQDAVTKELATKQDTLTPGNGISIEGNVISSTVDSLITPITYAELVALRNSSSLVAGMQYRITDYACTTTQENTQSAGHPFDIIVTADSENTLNEEARAIQHEGDTYFADCDLSAWKIWYCLDNDATRFAWADSVNGKGVIYRMIDEWNNDVPYDFKNIQFARDWSVIAPDSGLAGTIYCYTFSVFLDGFSEGATANDESVKAKECIESDGGGFFGNNKIALQNKGAYLINDIIFFTDWTVYSVNHFSNTFGNECYSNTFGNECYSNTFGNSCYSNTFGNSCYYNTFRNECNSNTFGNYCYSNSFGNRCYSNSFGNDCYNNSFGDYCYNNSFLGSCNGNSFGSNCFHNSLGNNCPYNSFGNNCCSNSLKDGCYRNSFRNGCNNNSFGSSCLNNSFGNNCQNNSFNSDCDNNSFGSRCLSNSFWSSCSGNSFGSNCSSNTFGNSCSDNSFGNNCSSNTFGASCLNNSFWSSCSNNSFGNNCYSNSFGNGCNHNSFRISASKTSTLKNYVQCNHFDDRCSYNVIWNGNTTSSTVSLKNINVNRGVIGTDSSYNIINIDVLNSEQEININQVDGIVSIGNILSITYESLKTLKDNSHLIPGQQYRIIDYITTTSQENTQSAGHQFDIIVTALDESTLSEEAQAIQNSNDGYFDGSNLSAWKIWYCLDNDTNRFAWAGNVKVGETEHKSYNSSECTINPELINGNVFITPFNFESCVWVDGNNDSDIPYNPNHDIDELVYEWGYFTDENNNTHLCIYKSDADLYAEEGHPDYGDKYLYRGVVNVDGTEYDYWQKWDQQSGNVDVYYSGNYVYATTPRIVSNPEAYSVTIKTEGIYGPGKGVIYRMIDEWNNDVPYDFKNIMYNGSWGYWAYTFNWINDESDNTCEDLSVAQYAHTNDEGGYSHTYGNIIKPYGGDEVGNYGSPCQLNACIFLNNESYEGGLFYGCFSNTFGNDCHSNTFGNDCNSNTFENNCHSNTFENNCHFNSFGNDCNSNTFSYGCNHNTFGYRCCSNTFGNGCFSNTFGDICISNILGNNCDYNTFGNNCGSIKFASSSSATTKYNYYQLNRFGDGCSFILFKATENISTSVQNYHFAQGLQGTSSAYLTIDGVRSRVYETKVAKNSSGELKIYCEADLIA